MDSHANGPGCHVEPSSIGLRPAPGRVDSGEARLLLEAFQMFTQASGSLESAFQQLQARTRRLSEELAAKNRELKKSLREKREVRNFLARILESLPCGVLVVDGGGRVKMFNRAAGQILGQPASVNTGRGDRHRSRSAIRRYLEAFADRENGGGEVEIPLTSGGRTKVLAAASTPFSSASGEVVGTLHIIRDVTEIKSLEAQSKRSERLAAMGEMAVELAHEIRNPLGSIELFASLLEKGLPRESEPGQWAENIRVGSRSLNNIVSNMLHFANPLTPQFHDVDLHALVQEILAFAGPILKQREVQVSTRFDSRGCTVCGDRELLKQMILNLILNSLQAMPKSGSLTVGTRDVRTLPGGVDCQGVELTVKDTGFGIPPENLGRIFDPFFTTNKNGTGLGLSVVHQIIEQHSGFVQVDSEVNAGTTFTIVLPGPGLATGAA